MEKKQYKLCLEILNRFHKAGILEDLILSGVQQAITQGKEMANSEMTKITGGMGLPGMGL